MTNTTLTGTHSQYVLTASGVTLTNLGTITGASPLNVKGSGDTVVNAGTIIGSNEAVYFKAGGVIINQPGGTISGGYGVRITGGSGTLVNAGSIGGHNFAAELAANYTNLVVIDPGAIFSGTVSGGNVIGASHTSTLELASGSSAGTLTGFGTKYIEFAQLIVDSGAQWSLAGVNTFALGVTLTNGGTLSDSGILVNAISIGTGIILDAGAVLTNTATGTIASTAGVAVTGTGPGITVVNAGTIEGGTGIGGSGAAGVYLKAGGTLTNTGTILGGPIAGGGTADSVNFGTGASRLILGATASFSGQVVAAGTVSNVLELAAGTGTLSGLGSQYIGFNQLTIDSGASWTLSGTDTISGRGNLTGTPGTGAVYLTTGTLTNAGVISGGNGKGNGGGTGQAGGGGVTLTTGTQVNSGTISGGYGGKGGTANINSTGSGGTGGTGVSLTGGILINSKTIAGGRGGYSAIAGGNGGVGGLGVSFTSGTLVNTGAITGGAGGDNSNLDSGGAGAAGVALTTGTVTNSGTITGGHGGFGGLIGSPFTAGAAGVGVSLTSGTLTSTGTIVGGYGGGGGQIGGTGAAGVSLTTGIVTNGGAITGGAGGYGSSIAAAGGVGAVLTTGTLTNSGTITGGIGGGARSNNGGTGGAGVSAISGTVTNTGTIRGGVGGASSGGAAGTGGVGVYFQAGGTLTNAGAILGGALAGGDTADAVDFGTGASRLILGFGAAFTGLVVAAATVNNVLELASGAATGTLTGLGTAFLGFDQVTIDSGARWSLTAANTITGATGAAGINGDPSGTGKIGGAAISFTTATLSSAGTITGGTGGAGGQGANGELGTGGGSGNTGGAGVSLTSGSLANSGTIIGGSGGIGGAGGTGTTNGTPSYAAPSGSGGYGGNGATGVSFTTGTVKNTANIRGGDGGTGGSGADGSPAGSGGTGGAGGAGVAFSSGSLSNSFSIRGGAGGTGGAAGNGEVGTPGGLPNPGGSGGYGGTGGAGVSLTSGTLTNSNAITGGAGGSGVYGGTGFIGGNGGYGGTGGMGVSLTVGTLINSGVINAGAGGVGGQGGAGLSNIGINGNGGRGGAGGVGVFLSGGTLINTGSIGGGDGNTGGAAGLAVAVAGKAGNAGAGGAGVYVASGTLTNRGTIIGGTGSTGGANGAGVMFQSGGTLTNGGTIRGGGTADAVDFGAGAARLILDPGASFRGNVVATATFTNVLELASGASAGTLSGFATQLRGFDQITVDSGANWTLASTQTVTGTAGASGAMGGAGVYVTNGTLTNRAVVNGGAGGSGGNGGAGILLTTGNLINFGTITGGTITGAGGVFGGSGVHFQSGGTLTNAGTIAGGSPSADAVDFGTGAARLILDPGATFSGAIAAAATVSNVLELAATTSVGTLASFAAYADFQYVVVDPNARWVLTNAVTITGKNGIVGDAAVTLANGTLTNQGVLTGGSGGIGAGSAGGVGVYARGGGVLVNSGTIAGGQGGTGGAGVYFQGGGTLTNFGSIRAASNLGGGNADAVNFGTGASRLILESGGSFGGHVVASATTVNILELTAGTGAETLSGLGSQYIGFQQVVIDDGADWVLTATNTITGNSPSPAVSFGTATLDSSATITGGTGIEGQHGQSGQNGGGAVSFTSGRLTNHGIIAGGHGGFTTSRYAGNGVYGVSFTSGNLINTGTIAGGNGGVGNDAGNGGAAVVFTTGVVTNTGVINGGTGASEGLSGGNGGAGAAFSTGTLVNDGTIIAGDGGFAYYGDLGGVGVSLTTGTLINNGTIVGGLGGASYDAAVRGADGVGVQFKAGGTLVDAGAISGGGTTAAVAFGTGAARLILDPGASFNGNVVANAAFDNVLELTSAASAGTLSGLGSQITGFDRIIVDSGADWVMTNADTIATGATLTNFGTVTVGSLANAGLVIDETGATLQVQGTVASGETIDFAGTSGLVAFDLTELMGGTITGFGTGVRLDLGDVTPGSVHYTATGGGEITFNFAGGGSGMIALPGGGPVTSVSDGHGGALVSTALCFCAGTRIATPSGEIFVQDLRAGDLVLTDGGAIRPLVWIGTGQVIVTPGHRSAATPVVVRKGALGDGVPYYDLRVTKGHSLLLDGVLIPVEFLVNHRSIQWDDHMKEVTIYHLELETHDVLLANGAPAESYRDDGNRWLFQNGNAGWDQPPKPPCAPVLTGGPEVDAVWRRLLDRAGPPAGLRLTRDPGVHLLVDGLPVEGTWRQDDHIVFTLSGRASEVRLVSRAGSPAELGLARDPRRLGVAVRQFRLWQGVRLRTMEASDQALQDGFHPFEPDIGARWTDGDARLPTVLFAEAEGVCKLDIVLGGTTRYPLLPLCA